MLRSKKTLETELAEKEKGLQSKMAEISRLAEENDRLSEQLASAIERPKGTFTFFLLLKKLCFIYFILAASYLCFDC